MPFDAAPDNTPTNKPSKKKPIFPVNQALRQYLQVHGREVKLPVSYSDLLHVVYSVPLKDKHEIGHTLGLRHNMGSSSLTPVEKLRDKAWVEAHGHTSSIMDYARFNYVAQPEDRVSPKGLYPRIGPYDLWAIQWGYKNIPDTRTSEQDKKILNQWIIDSLKANPLLWFGGEGQGFDPRAQTEDLSDNAMKASGYGVMNLKRIIVLLPA